ncbi:hypothetical protein OFO11_26630, partial [Escherichia coli]|nr:hypothetical protein [Escherichia coli]
LKNDINPRVGGRGIFKHCHGRSLQNKNAAIIYPNSTQMQDSEEKFNPIKQSQSFSIKTKNSTL